MKLVVWLARAVLLIIAVVSGLAVEARAEEELPEGKGKETLEHTCTECHGLDKVFKKLRTRQDWKVTLTRMRTAGATMTAAQFDALLDYLVEFFGEESADDGKRSSAKGLKRH